MTKKSVKESDETELEEELEETPEEDSETEDDSEETQEPETKTSSKRKFLDENKFTESFSHTQSSSTSSLERVIENENPQETRHQITSDFQEQETSRNVRNEKENQEQNLYRDYSPNIYETEREQIQRNVNLIASAEKIEPINFSIASPTTIRRDSNLIINPELRELQRQSQQKTDRDYITKAKRIDRGKTKLPFEQDISEDYNFR